MFEITKEKFYGFQQTGISAKALIRIPIGVRATIKKSDISLVVSTILNVPERNLQVACDC